jgi:hypothetical protein
MAAFLRRGAAAGRTAALTPSQLATVAPFPFIVWGADETRRWLIRRYHKATGAGR